MKKIFTCCNLVKPVILSSIILLLFSLSRALLSPLAMPASSITQPDGIDDIVGGGDDFATVVLRDPWDMNEESDVWEMQNMSDAVFANGTLHFTAGADSYFWILHQGYYSAQNIGKTGVTYPINADHYRVLSFRMWSASEGFAYVYWYKDQDVGNYAVSDPIHILPGWHIYTADLENIGFQTGGGGTGWYGQVAGLRFNPYKMSGVTSNVIEIDWVRLTPRDTSHSIPISWSGVSGSVMELYLDDDTSDCDGPLIGTVTSSPDSGTFNWGDAVLPNTGSQFPYPLPLAIAPGNYYVCGRVDDGSPFYSSGPLTVDASPMLWFTYPGYLTGSDYATAAGIPWDMNHEDTFTWMSGIDNYEFSNGQFHAVNSGGDPALRFNTPVALDTNRYKYFTLRMYLEGNYDLYGGWVARVLWYNTPHQPSIIDDIVIHPGWNIYTIDLTKAALETGSSPWSAGSWSWFRFDPNENIRGVPWTFHLDYAMLTADPTGETNSSVPIWYKLSEQDNVTVTLYYDTDTNPDNGKTPIDTFHYGSALYGLGDATMASPSSDSELLAPSQASLDVTKYTNSDTVQPGSPLTYTLYVTNTGSVSLTATITDVLPNHVTPTGTLTWTPTITTPVGVWTETVVVTVEMGYAGPLTNVVRVTTDEGAMGIYTHTLVPGLEMTKHASPNSVQAGETLTYTIYVTNTGDFALHTTITDTLPNHVTPTGTLTWTPTITTSGSVWTETVVVTVEMGYAGPLTNVVRVTTDEGAMGAYTETVMVLHNQSPHTPSNPTPTDGAESVPIAQTLGWQGGDPDGDPVIYTVAFGTSDPPSPVFTTTLTNYTPSLITETTYYWGITASDGISASVGATWRFTTIGPFRLYLPIVMREYLVTDLPQPTGIRESWDTIGVPAGSYYILAEVTDGYNTARWYSDVPIILTDD